MAFSAESKVIRKKRTMGRRIPKSFFKNIPIELELKIFEGLCLKDRSRAMCVSHSWRERILNTTLPKEKAHRSLVRLFHNHFLDLHLQKLYLQQLFDWCSQVMRCMVSPKELIDTCNGLLLFCHNKGRAENLTRSSIYHYYVVNHATKQCVAIPKPVGQNSGGYSYANLVYDPTESWYFKIMRFQGRKHVNIFSSENGVWTTLTLSLPEYIIESSWLKISTYFNGSVYRLTLTGHLIKIKVDPQENISEQAEIIPLPPNSLFLLDNFHWALSVKSGKLIFVVSRGVTFMVYELVECITRNVTSYSWCNTHSIEALSLLPFNTNGNLLSFHPYYNVAFFKLHKNSLYCLNISNNHNMTNIRGIPYSDILYDYLRCRHPPLFRCFKSFICCLNKEHNSGVFQRLSILP